MELYFENETDYKFDFDAVLVATNVINKALELHDCDFDTEISVMIVDNDSIHEINKETRDVDKATDVLSFPNIEFENPGDFNILKDDESYFDYLNPDSKRIVLGDIIISYEKVLSQALEYEHSILREYAFLVTHSILHLLGYDHIIEEDRIIMEDKQKEILDLLKIYRD